MDAVSIIYRDHDKWVKAVINFGCNEDTAKDLVQEMYAKLHIMIQNGLDIMYGEDEVNYFYVYRTLQTLFLDLKRRESRVTYVEVSDHMATINADETDLNDIYDELQEKLGQIHWYDRKVYEIIDGGESISSLSRDTKISYYSLYNTYNRVKRYLRKFIDKT